jgi:hypothetical protein
VLSTTGGAIARVLVNPTGILYARSDVTGVQRSSAVALGSGWHTIELCVTIGTNGTIDLYRDGARIVAAFGSDVGTASIDRVLIGDTGAKTFTVNFDDVVLDQSPG